MHPSCISFITHTFSVPIQNKSLIWSLIYHKMRGLGFVWVWVLFFPNSNVVTCVFHPVSSFRNYCEYTLQKYLLAPFSIYLVLVLSLMLVETLGAWWSFWCLAVVGLLEQYWLPISIHSHYLGDISSYYLCLFIYFCFFMKYGFRSKTMYLCAEFSYSHMFCLQKFGFLLLVFLSISVPANL